MGAKSSKTADVFITEDVTYTKLTGNELSIYEGNSCEYVALDVSLYLPDEGMFSLYWIHHFINWN